MEVQGSLSLSVPCTHCDEVLTDANGSDVAGVCAGCYCEQYASCEGCSDHVHERDQCRSEDGGTY